MKRIALLVAVLFLIPAQVDISQHSNPSLLGWIPASCCVTNDCCWEISEKEIEPLQPDPNLPKIQRFRIKESGQVVYRKGPSPDGKFYRCACKFTGAKYPANPWVRDPTGPESTRCLFTPDPSI